MKHYVQEKTIEMFGAPITVYDDGSVWIRRGSRNKRRFGNITDKGYRTVLIRDNGKERTVFVHRLVALAFVPNPQNKPQINHKDGNKLNNRPENLEWCTNAENAWHRANIIGKFSAKTPVRCVETNEVFETTSEASRKKNVNRGNICRAMKRGITAGGYHWERIGD